MFNIGDIVEYNPSYSIHSGNPWKSNIGERFKVEKCYKADYNLSTYVDVVWIKSDKGLGGVSSRNQSCKFKFRAAAFILVKQREPDWEI